MEAAAAAWDKKVQHAKAVSKKLHYYDMCLFRMAHKHSWYKRRGEKVTITLVPVLGNVQEPGEPYLDCELKEPSPYKPTDILWHFVGLPNRCSPWHTNPCPELQSVIEANKVQIPDVATFYFDHGHWSRSIHVHTNPKSTNWIDFYPGFDAEVDRWICFRPVYQHLAKAARNIAEFLVANPNLPLPVMKSWNGN